MVSKIRGNLEVILRLFFLIIGVYSFFIYSLLIGEVNKLICNRFLGTSVLLSLPQPILPRISEFAYFF